MAVQINPVETTMRLQVKVGQKANGDPILAVRSYGNIKPGTLADDLFEVAQAIANLQKYPLNAVQRLDESDLASI